MDPRMAATWWTIRDDARAQADAVWTHLRALEQREMRRLMRDCVNERIYSSDVAGGARAMDLVTLFRSMGFQSADLNFTRQIVDALVARVGNNYPAIHAEPDGADWSHRRLAKQMDKLIAGEMDQMDIQAEAPLCLRAALNTRAGAFKVMAHKGDIVGDRIPVDELRVDSREGTRPRQLHHIKAVAREVLAETHPEHRAAIQLAKPRQKRPHELDDTSYVGGETNMLDVCESIHLPSKEGAADGVRVISIEETVLLAEPWKRPRFNVAFLRWSPPQRGFWGSCLVDELASLQFKVNEVARDLMQNIYFTSAVKVLRRRNSQVESKHVSGKKPHFIDVDNPTDVAWEAPDGFSPAQFQFLQWLIQQMFEVSGVSQLMAQSKNPLGAGASGAALSNFYDIESERFSQLELGYARFWRDIAALTVDAAKDLSQSDEFKRRTVRWSKRGLIHQVKWSDVKNGLLQDDSYQLRLEAAGYLPNTRTGKMQAIEQLVANGFLDAKWVPTLMDFPDLKEALAVKSAPVEYVMSCMEKLEDVAVDENDEVIPEKSAPPPTPLDDAPLELCIEVGKAMILQHTADESPVGVIARFSTWNEICDAKLKESRAAQPVMAGVDPAMAAVPPGPPGMAPPLMAGGAPPPMPAGPPELAAMPMESMAA